VGLSHTFSLHLPNIPPDRAQQVAWRWLTAIGAKEMALVPGGYQAVFGTAMTFGWKRNAKKVLHLQFQPSGAGSHLHLTLDLTAAHADEVAMFSGKILQGWEAFANELWSQFGGAGVVTSAPITSSLRAMSAQKRAGYLAVAVLMFAGIVPLALYARGFVLWTLGGALIGGGLFALAAGVIGKEPAPRSGHA